MDTDWVFNFDCNDKVTNVDAFFDANVILLKYNLYSFEYRIIVTLDN